VSAQPGARVSTSVQDGIAILELCQPPANCYSYEMMRELDDAILRARFADDVHVLVLRGSGDKFFCAGADIGMLQRVTPQYKYYFCLHANETLNRLEQTPKLVIAALNGHCVGGGLEIAMAADLRVARRGGGRIGRLPQAGLGEVGGVGVAGGVAGDHPDARPAVAAGAQLLHPAVVEAGRAGPLVLDEDLGELAARAQRGAEHPLDHTLVEHGTSPSVATPDGPPA
jgi:enoyl-CoA hydratase/carnithine racemase